MVLGKGTECQIHTIRADTLWEKLRLSNRTAWLALACVCFFVVVVYIHINIYKWVISFGDAALCTRQECAEYIHTHMRRVQLWQLYYLSCLFGQFGNLGAPHLLNQNLHLNPNLTTSTSTSGGGGLIHRLVTAPECSNVPSTVATTERVTASLNANRHQHNLISLEQKTCTRAHCIFTLTEQTECRCNQLRPLRCSKSINE